MNILSIDVGSYSVKFLEFRLERGRLVLDHIQQIRLSDVTHNSKSDGDDKVTTEILQKKAIQSYMQELQFSGKIISQIPSQLITNRFIDIPINNRKKAEMMIPHQLDGNLPYPMSQAHFTSSMFKSGNQFFAIINVTKRSSFTEHYTELNKRKILPTHMYSELSTILAYTWEKKIKGPICLIDIGHNTSKAYFIHDGKVVSGHTSYTAGKSITETIAETYKIPLEDAEVYKHEKCFFLTEDQYNQVNDSQKDFAKLMKQVMIPLVSDFKRWELGFRVNNALPIEKVLICGGTTNIENIENFLTQNFEVKVEKMTDIFTPKDKVQMSAEENSIFMLGNMMALTQISKRPPTNFLTGEYLSNFSDKIPLHSSMFLASRSFIISLILGLGLLINIIITSKENNEISQKVTKLLKSKVLELTPREIRSFKSSPTTVYKKLLKKERDISASINSLNSSTTNNAIIPLAELSKIVGKNDKVNLTSFSSEANLAMATFSTDSPSELIDLRNRLDKSSLMNKKINHKEGDNKLTIEFGY